MKKQRIQFEIESDTVVGDLYLPEGAGPHPAVIMGGPMTSVKEQVTGVYAHALSKRGFAALALDHRHYGESEGQPRQYEKSAHKIEDLKAGLDALAQHESIDANRLGAVGVCLGTGYVMWASIGHPRVKALGGVAGYYRDVQDMKQKDPEGFQAKVHQGIEARKHYEATKQTLTIPAVALDQDAAMTLKDTFDYYGTPRAGVPNYTNAFAVMSREHFLPFDVQPAAPRITVPVAMIHSEKALSPHWARKYYDNLTVEKQLHWLDSKNQVDFYDQPDLVNSACDLLRIHLEKQLR